MKRVIVPSHRVPAAGVGAHALVLSPDGRYALTTQLDWSVEPMRTALRHCDLQSGESTVTSRAELQLRLFADARHVLMGDAQSAGTVIVDVLDGSTVATRWPTSDGAISPDGTLFVTATGADDGELRCIERDGTVRWRQKSRDYARFVLCAWATASRIVVACEPAGGGKLIVIDAATGGGPQLREGRGPQGARDAPRLVHTALADRRRVEVDAG